MEKKKSISKNSFFYLVYNVLNVVFPLITGIYVAHILLPSSIGEVEAARNLTQYFVILSFLGIPTYGLREIARQKEEKDQLNKTYSELMIINAVSTTVCIGGYFGVVFAVPAYRNSVLLFSITGILIFLNYFNNSWLFEGLEEFGLISLRNILFKTISFIFLIVFVRDVDDYLIYAAVTVVGTAGNYAWNMIITRRFAQFTIHDLHFSRHLKPILALVIVNLAIEIYSLVDVTMLNLMCSKDSVAFYSYGSKIQKILMTVVNSFTMVIVPRISFYFKMGQIDRYNALITKTLKVILILSVPMIVGIWFVSGFLLTAIYGEAYAPSVMVLKILSFDVLISPVGYLLGSRVMLVTGNENKMVIPVAAGAIVNILCNFFLIQLYQESGAAIASIISQLVVAGIYIILGRKLFKLIELPNTIWKVSLASLVLAAFLLAVSFVPIKNLYQTLIQISGGVIVYFLVLLATKEDLIIYYGKRVFGRLFKHD